MSKNSLWWSWFRCCIVDFSIFFLKEFLKIGMDKKFENKSCNILPLENPSLVWSIDEFSSLWKEFFWKWNEQVFFREIFEIFFRYLVWEFRCQWRFFLLRGRSDVLVYPDVGLLIEGHCGEWNGKYLMIWLHISYTINLIMNWVNYSLPKLTEHFLQSNFELQIIDW